MKRIIVMLIMAAVFFAGTAMAASHTVVKGECLSVIGAQYHLSWRKIAAVNSISGPKFVIYPGQKLIIPEKSRIRIAVKENRTKVKRSLKYATMRLVRPIYRLGVSPLHKDLTPNDFQSYDYRRLGRALGLSRDERVELMKLARDKKFQRATIHPIYRNGHPVMQYAVMLYKGYRRTLNRAPAWKSGQDEAVFRFKLSSGKTVDFIQKCGNAGIYTYPLLANPVVKAEKRAKTPTQAKPRKVASRAPFTAKVTREQGGKKGSARHATTDLLGGAGIYGNAGGEPRHNGWYVWGIFRYRPEFLRWRFWGEEYNLGIHAFGNIFGGKDNDYNYHGKSWAVGPTLKVFGKHWDADMDAGWGKLYNYGGIYLYDSHQTDNLFRGNIHANFYARRDKGKKFLPKTEINFLVNYPIGSDQHHSWDNEPLDPKPFDNHTWELFLRQGIYDCQVTDNLRVTPEIQLRFGHEYGNHVSYYQIGPALTFSWRNRDIVNLYFLNYKEKLGADGDQWHWVGGHVDSGELATAYKATRITNISGHNTKAQTMPNTGIFSAPVRKLKHGEKIHHLKPKSPIDFSNQDQATSFFLAYGAD